MAESTVVKVRRDGTITILDGAGSPLSYTVAYENGDLSYAEDKAGRIVIRDRGTIVGLRAGDDPVQSLSFSVHLRAFAITATNATLIDVIQRTGAWVAATSTGGTGFEQFLVTVKITVEGTDQGDSADHVATFAKVLLTYDVKEGDPDTLNVKGEIYGGITRTGPAT
jgi:hypothetical protein